MSFSYFFLPFLLLLSSLIQIQAAQIGQSQCIKNFGCVTIVYDDESQSLNHTIEMPSGFLGWFSIGDLNRMKGSNMMVAWVDNGMVVSSQRSATGEVMPTISFANSHQSFTSITSSVTTSSISISWISTGLILKTSSNPFIWASNSNNQPGSDSNSKLIQHRDNQRGHFTVDFTAPYSSSSSSNENSTGTGATNSPQSNDENVNSSSLETGRPNRNLRDASVKVQLVHAIFMSVAFLGCFPAGALIARYGRTFTSKWFPTHHWIQLFGTLLVIIGFILAVIWINLTNEVHFERNHEKVGLALFIAVILQVILGEISHCLLLKKGIRTGYVHILLGISIFGVSIWEIKEGLESWEWKPSKSVTTFVYVWAGIIGVAYFAGFALIPRELKQRKEKKVLEEKRFDVYTEEPLMNQNATRM